MLYAGFYPDWNSLETPEMKEAAFSAASLPPVQKVISAASPRPRSKRALTIPRWRDLSNPSNALGKNDRGLPHANSPRTPAPHAVVQILFSPPACLTDEGSPQTLSESPAPRTHRSPPCPSPEPSSLTAHLCPPRRCSPYQPVLLEGEILRPLPDNEFHLAMC